MPPEVSASVPSSMILGIGKKMEKKKELKSEKGEMVEWKAETTTRYKVTECLGRPSSYIMETSPFFNNKNTSFFHCT